MKKKTPLKFKRLSFYMQSAGKVSRKKPWGSILPKYPPSRENSRFPLEKPMELENSTIPNKDVCRYEAAIRKPSRGDLCEKRPGCEEGKRPCRA
jgi:hypothetical protein